MEVRLPNDLTFPGSIGNATSTLAQASVRAAQVDRADGFPSPCDARLFAERGSDVVVWGPGDLHKAHSDNESIDVKDLQNYCKMLARLCADPKLERIPYAQ